MFSDECKYIVENQKLDMNYIMTKAVLTDMQEEVLSFFGKDAQKTLGFFDKLYEKRYSVQDMWWKILKIRDDEMKALLNNHI